MSDPLDHKFVQYPSKKAFVKKIQLLASRFDQEHHMQRKFKFLLDIRGFLKINQLKGNYIEFGSFISEMHYAAYYILDSTQMIDKYIGLDTFEGEPEMNEEEVSAMPVTRKGQFSANYEETKKLLKKYMPDKGILIKGDFRQYSVIAQCDKYAPFNVAVVDCNLLSSLESGIRYSLKNLINGGLLFVDDYFSNFGEGKPLIPDMITTLSKQINRRLIPHGFYPPFAKSFIITEERNL